MRLSDKAREALRHVSTATLTTVLFKRGLRNAYIQGVGPLNPDAPDHGRRGLHAALHPLARGSRRHRRVQGSEPSAARGGRSHPARACAGHGLPRRCFGGLGRKHPDHAHDDPRRGRRRERRRLARFDGDRATALPVLLRRSLGADQPDQAPRRRPQRADRLRRRSGFSGRHPGRRRRRRGGDPGQDRRGGRAWKRPIRTCSRPSSPRR